MAALRKKSARKVSDDLGQTGQNLIRILIASYFIGVSIGLINGTNAAPLLAFFMPPEPASLVGKSIIFVLAYFVMTGLWLRPAALLLGLVTFWSSYIANFSTPGTVAIGDFWRDLTLIGALMLTYVQSSPRAARRRKMIRLTPQARRVMPGKPVTPRRVSAARSAVPARSDTVVPLNRRPAPSHPPRQDDPLPRHANADNIFLDDLAAS